MHPIGVSPVAFFWGAILAWGAQAVIWRARPRNAPPPYRRACCSASVTAQADYINL